MKLFSAAFFRAANSNNGIREQKKLRWRHKFKDKQKHLWQFFFRHRFLKSKSFVWAAKLLRWLICDDELVCVVTPICIAPLINWHAKKKCPKNCASETEVFSAHFAVSSKTSFLMRRTKKIIPLLQTFQNGRRKWRRGEGWLSIEMFDAAVGRDIKPTAKDDDSSTAQKGRKCILSAAAARWCDEPPVSQLLLLPSSSSSLPDCIRHTHYYQHLEYLPDTFSTYLYACRAFKNCL